MINYISSFETKDDFKIYRDLLSNLSKENIRVKDNIKNLKIEIEKEKKAMKELSEINEKKKELKDKLCFSKSIYDGICLKLQRVSNELKFYEQENKKLIDKMKEFSDLKSEVENKKKIIRELQQKKEKLNKDLKMIYSKKEEDNLFNNNYKNNNNILNGLDELINEMKVIHSNENKRENENAITERIEKEEDKKDGETIEEVKAVEEKEVKEIKEDSKNEENEKDEDLVDLNNIEEINFDEKMEEENNMNLASFVFSSNKNINGDKEKNNQDFGIESLTKRKPFGDFNFD